MDSRDGESPPPSPGAEPAFLAGLLPVLHRIAANGFRIPCSDREDVIQEALLDFVRYRRGHAASAGLLIRIVQRRCQDYWRAAARRREVSLETLEKIAAPASSDNPCESLRLIVAWRLLSPECRRYLARRFWRNERTRDLAAKAGKSYSALRRFMSRCLARLRRSVEER
jgi:DNA-directed RNA polymerase specialized sigma24 family protein